MNSTMSSQSATAPAPGYHPDPATGLPRWWDGSAWGAFAPQAAAAQGAPVARLPNTGLGIAALVLGILWIYGIGSVLAIIFGALGRKECDRGEKQGRGMATAGLVLGIIGVALLAALIILRAAAASAGAA